MLVDEYKVIIKSNKKVLYETRTISKRRAMIEANRLKEFAKEIGCKANVKIKYVGDSY